ncbi:MAG: hypothetical protein AB1489_27105 [Acidobacteriota bacterium]
MLKMAIDHYNEVLSASDWRALAVSLQQGISAKKMHVRGGRTICEVLRPRFIVPRQYERLETAARLIGQAIIKMGQAMLSDKALLEPCGLSEAEQALLAMDGGFPETSLFGRLDGFIADDGEWLYFLESNLESPAGIAYDEALAEIFLTLPAMVQFQRCYQVSTHPVRPRLLTLLLDAYQRWGGKGTPTIAIVDYRSVPTWSEFLHCEERFNQDGIPTLLADPGELSYQGGRLYAAGREIDLVYRRVLTSELLEKYDLSHPLIRAYADRAVCVVNPFRTKPVHTKLVMAYLCDERFANLFTEDERAAIAAHIPWTRLLKPGKTTYQGETIDLISFIDKNRERLVLKPNDAYGGSGVCLGWRCSDREWEEAKTAATNVPFIVQQRVPIPQEDYPVIVDDTLKIVSKYVDADPCYFNGEALGCMTRIAGSDLLNVSAGGGSAPPTFLVVPK